ncbi:RIP metalloprotease RseP [Acidiferrobacter sp.]|uniref:RIP metalloprotease RseP n=1 Tax=Acidiferrobacter sp. TaxID=1872107 RepID=UPI00262D9203|nr:RIP metalloprotease RseP [Acidiferrobacter sp.]
MLTEIGYSLLGFVLAIGILIVVHEFGHFIVARSLGVKVLRFSVGFGKPIFLRRAGADATEYVLAAVPLGGYVKMLDENEGEVAPAELHRAFNRQPLWKRTAIVLAGPGFNFLFAILAYWVVFVTGVPGLKPIIGKVVPHSPAQAAGLRAGDLITRINGRRVQSFGQDRLYLFQEALEHAKVRVQVLTKSGHKRLLILNLHNVHARELGAGHLGAALGISGWQPKLVPRIAEVEAHTPAARGGLRVGDLITRIGAQTITNWAEVARIVRAHPLKPLRFDVRHHGHVRQLIITPKAVKVGPKRIGQIGAGIRVPTLPPGLQVVVRLGPLAAFKTALDDTWLMTRLTVEMLGKMLMLEVSPKGISGPITIAQYAGYSVQVGFTSFLMFLGVVSISLGVLNLMPVPILDGGHVLFYVIEWVKGGPISEKVVGWGQRVGVTLLLGLMVLAFYNDITRILG